MLVTIDFNSEEALYIQLRNQIIIGIAAEKILEGESLPSVRELADNIGINMHTVNKAYSILRQEGYLKLDRRKGAVIAVDADKYQAKEEMSEAMRVIMAEGICKNISCEEIHELVDQIYADFKGGGLDMLCEKCHKREAKVYYTEIVNGEKKEQYLCEECAAKYTSFQIEKNGVDGGLEGLLSSILSNYYGEKQAAPTAEEKSIACPTCGITYEEVLKAGKLGCADCYHVFEEMIERTLRQIQGADTHIGKLPSRQKKTAEKKSKEKKLPSKKETVKEKIERLSLQLQKAVEIEEFEEAVKLRDEIRALKKEAGKDAKMV